MIIDFKNVSFNYTDKTILDSVNFTLTENDKTGLVGVNGAGKSTIIKLILGEERPKSGEIIKSGNMSISYLDQNPYIEEGQTFFEYVIKDSSKEHPIAEYEANTAITKMKLDPKRIVKNLSGGEKKRLALAKALVTYSDFLLLDEPTNHLDNDMISYLEKYLERFNRGFLLVTHDRYFLEKCCNNMLELDNGKIYQYKANYSLFLELKKERLENTLAVEAKLKKYLKKELEWLNRGVEARRTKSKSRIERYEEASKTNFSEEKNFEFSSISSYLGKKIISIRNACKSINGRVLFEDFNIDIKRDARIGIVGDNGAGKTTLFKTIMGLENLDSGEIEKGETLNIGYFSQHFDNMNEELTVLKYIEEDSNRILTLDGEISAKALLNKFLFDDELLYTKIKSLSGGEKRRLQLVKVLSKNPNVLILDEPTNDLDIYTIEVLERYLDSFIGPILCVSHDRYFLDNMVDEILYFKDGHINYFLGNFSNFLESENSKKSESQVKGTQFQKKHTSIPSKLKKDIEAHESKISELDLKTQELNNILNSNQSDYLVLVDAQKDLDKINIEYELVLEEYMALLEEKENYTKE